MKNKKQKEESYKSLDVSGISHVSLRCKLNTMLAKISLN